MKHVSSEQWGLRRIALDAWNKKHLVNCIFKASKLNSIPLFSQSTPFQMSTNSLWNRPAMKRLHNTDVLSAKPNHSKHAGEGQIFMKHLQKSQYNCKIQITQPCLSETDACSLEHGTDVEPIPMKSSLKDFTVMLQLWLCLRMKRVIISVALYEFWLA